VGLSAQADASVDFASVDFVFRSISLDEFSRLRRRVQGNAVENGTQTRRPSL
jgi:hypothetical protein